MPDTSQPGWFRPYLERERAKPRHDQPINGIQVGPTARHDINAMCVEGSVREAPIDAAAGDPTMINVTYVPPGGTVAPGRATVCQNPGGQQFVIATDQIVTVAPDISVGRFGGSITISRWRGGPSATVDVPADRWTAETIAGQRAAVAAPALPSGVGESAIVIFANGVMTKIQASWIPLDELRRLAEGLF